MSCQKPDQPQRTVGGQNLACVHLLLTETCFFAVHDSFIERVRYLWAAVQEYENTRSLVAPDFKPVVLRAGFEPFDLVDFVLRALQALRLCDPCNENC